jgi:hypothetical protein
MNKLGFQPDPWQVELLEAGHARLLLNSKTKPAPCS